MLDINLGAVITQAIAFILLVLVLGKVAFRPISGMIETRQNEIRSALEQVAADRKAMEETRASYERRLADFEAESRERITEYMRTAQEEAAHLRAKAQEETSAQRERALAEIDQERKKAVSEIRSQMAELAVVAASKVLGREINPSVHRELITDFISEVGNGARARG